MGLFKGSFSKKLIKLLVFVIFMPMTISSIYISLKLYHITIQNSAALNESNLNSISNNLTSYFRNFSYITDSIFVSDSLQKLLKNTPSSPYETLMANREYADIMHSLTLNTYSIENIFLFASDGTDYFYNNSFFFPDIKKFSEEFSDVNSDNSPCFTGFFTTLHSKDIVYVPVIMQPIFDLKTREYLGIAVVQFYPNVYNNLLSYNTDPTILINSENKIIYSSDNSYLNSSVQDLFPNGLDKRITYKNQLMIPTYLKFDNGYQLVQLKDCKTSNFTFFMETVPVIWLFFACTLIFIVIAILLAKRLISPIKVLQSAMTTPWPEELGSYVDIHTHDEFEDLGNSYNHMLEQLNLFIEKSYNQEIQHLNAEFRALQSQINPHFLYNALESINSTAQIKHEPEISRMVCCLADMLRYTTQQTNKLIPLRQEIQHVKNYYQLQNISCNNKVSMQCKIPDRLLDEPVPKMIIQPIIENCFNHGLDYSHENLQIILSIEKNGNTLLIKTQDNGCGIPPEDLARIREKLDNPTDYDNPDTSIGLLNINQRLKMIYQPGSGLEISSIPQEGTTILLKLIEKEQTNV